MPAKVAVDADVTNALIFLSNNKGEFTVKLQAFLDQVSIIKPVELRTSDRRERLP